MRLRPALALVALAGLAACGGPEREKIANDGTANGVADVATGANVADGAEVASTTNEGMPGNEAVPGSAPVATLQAQPFDRLGPIRVGVTLRQLAREGLTVARRDEPLDEGSTCTYATFKGMPDIAVMLDGERLVRIDVSGRQLEAPGGVRVGQSEAEALRRLGGRAKVEPHPYTGPQGHYLIVHEAGAPRGLIVETDGKTVETWRIGQWEQVQWIEGCA